MRDGMYDKIQKTLLEIEEDKKIRILYAAESGSRGWGFPSIDSDYHCRFIYVNKQDFYLAINSGKDSIEFVVDSIYDIKGWDLKKVLKELNQSNPAILEWLQSPVVYMERDDFRSCLLELFASYFDEKAALCYYRDIAVNKLEEIKKHPEERIKRYCHVLRALLAAEYIMKFHSMPPMTFDQLYENASIKEGVQEEIEKLIELKKQCSDWYKVPTNHLVVDFFEEFLTGCNHYISGMKHKIKQNDEATNQFFRTWIKAGAVR